MFLSEVEELLRKWHVGDARVFYYYDYWSVRKRETIILERKEQDLFVTVKDKSTVSSDNFTEDEIKRFLVKDLLVERAYESVNKNYRDEKTGGCNCGAWATSMADNPQSHWEDCPAKYGKRS